MTPRVNTPASELLEEVMQLRRRVAELERTVGEVREIEAQLREHVAEQDALLQALPAIVYFKRRDHRYVRINQVYTETLGVTPDEIIGRTDHEVFPPEMAQSFYTIDEAVMASGQPRLGYETELPHHDGGTWWISEYNVPYRSADGTVTGLVGVAIDITARKVAEEALRHNEAQLREIITQQDQLIETIKALASPVLPIEDQILVLPLVGHIDSARGEQILNAMLTSVQQYSAAWLIIDITGVPVIDTAVAHHLLQAARGVSLLGAHCMLVGVSPEIAQTLVQLGVDLSTFTTLSNLQMGIAYARSQLPRMRARHV